MAGEEQEDKDFDDGFTEESNPVAKKADTPAEPAPTEPEPPAPEPKFIQLTEEQYAALEDSRKKSEENAKQIQKLFGTTGALTRDVNGIKGTDKPIVMGLSAEDIGKLVGETTSSTFRSAQIETLDAEYPTWREDVGAVKEGETPDENHPFRQWLEKQSPEYKNLVSTTFSATVIGRAIDRFKAETAPPAPAEPAAPAPPPAKAKPVVVKPARPNPTNRFKNAVTPKTAGGAPPARTKTADDEFEEGYAEG